MTRGAAAAYTNESWPDALPHQRRGLFAPVCSVGMSVRVKIVAARNS